MKIFINNIEKELIDYQLYIVAYKKNDILIKKPPTSYLKQIASFNDEKIRNDFEPAILLPNWNSNSTTIRVGYIDPKFCFLEMIIQIQHLVLKGLSFDFTNGVLLKVEFDVFYNDFSDRIKDKRLEYKISNSNYKELESKDYRTVEEECVFTLIEERMRYSVYLIQYLANWISWYISEGKNVRDFRFDQIPDLFNRGVKRFSFFDLFEFLDKIEVLDINEEVKTRVGKDNVFFTHLNVSLPFRSKYINNLFYKFLEISWRDIKLTEGNIFVCLETSYAGSAITNTYDKSRFQNNLIEEFKKFISSLYKPTEDLYSLFTMEEADST